MSDGVTLARPSDAVPTARDDPADATRSGARRHAEADAHAAFDALDALGDAVALVDVRQRTVRACTAAFVALVPAAAAGVALARLERDCPGLGASVAEAAPSRTPTAARAPRSVRIGDLALVRTCAPDPCRTTRSGDVHDYLRARDDLFSRSRTISVSEMATTLAHEINQPVGTVVNLLRGARRRLARGGDDAATVLERLVPALDAALEQALYTSSVVARIRDFTRSRRPAREPVEVGALVRRSVALLDWLLDAEGCRVELALPDAPTRVTGDETMLQQVLVNLIRNAVEAMRETPRGERSLRVEARLDRARLALAVADRGQGLGGAEADLFVPFATAKPDGMGVGLNICRSFVELHGGRLWLASNEHGGCTARVELPLAEEDTA